MTILTTSTDIQTIKVIPRQYSDNVSLNITNKDTNESFDIVSSASNSNGYMTIDVSLSLSEGITYKLIVSDVDNGLGTLYRGLIFCTDQEDLNQPYDYWVDDVSTVENEDDNIIIF